MGTWWKDDTSLKGRMLILLSDARPRRVVDIARALGVSRQSIYRGLQTMGAAVLHKSRGVVQIRRI